MSARAAILSAVRLWVAILAAWATFVAPLLPTGAAASPVFGPALILCSTAGHVDGSDPDRSTHDGTHLCCIGPAGAGAAGPAGVAELGPPAAGYGPAPFRPVVEAPAPAPPERHPLAPRAPPPVA